MTLKGLLSLTAVSLFLLTLAACTAVSSNPQPTPSPSPPVPQYYSPLQNAQYVSKDASIIVRYGPRLTEQDVAQLNFAVQGAQSGPHSGKATLADDKKTIIFKPDSAFTPGEQVSVNVTGLNLDGSNVYDPLSYSFNVSIKQSNGSPLGGSVPNSTPQSAFPNFLTVPQNIPGFTVQTSSSSLNSEGDIFVAPFYWTGSTVGSYLLILNGQGAACLLPVDGRCIDGSGFQGTA